MNTQRGTTSIHPPNKTCPHCGVDKLRNAFHRDRSHKDGLCSSCKMCHNSWQRAWRKNNPGKAKAINQKHRRKHGRNYDLQRFYGITLMEYNLMRKKQGYGCAICRSIPFQHRLQVDHDHRTGEIRGLLCEGCNKGLGCFRDDVTRMRTAIKYLKTHCD